MSQITTGSGTYTIPGSPLAMVGLASSLEELFAAAASCNRGATAPSSPFEGMLWWDSSANPEILKRYTAVGGWSSIVSVNITTGVMTISGHVANSLFVPNTILAANTDSTPAAVTVDEQRIVGRKAGGYITALTGAEVAAIVGTSVPPWVYMSDVKSAGVDGGTASAGWGNNRELNTIDGSTGYSSWCALGSLTINRFTLAVGSYFVDASAPAFLVKQHKLALKNFTTSTFAIIGSTEMSGASFNTQTRSFVKGKLTVSNATDQYGFVHYVDTPNSGDGLGIASGSYNETYTMCHIVKLS